MELNLKKKRQSMRIPPGRMESMSGPQAVREVSGDLRGTAAKMRFGKNNLQQGFTLIEALITIAIMGIVSSIAIIAISTIMPTIRANSARQQLMNQLVQAHQASIDQRRNYWVIFQGTGEAVTWKVNLDGTQILVADYVLPYNMIYYLFPGLPDTPPPDRFGKLTPVTFNCLTLPCKIIFQSDGSVLDSNGNVVNGTVFMGIVGQTQTASAITIMGTTGRMKGYSYASGGWH